VLIAYTRDKFRHQDEKIIIFRLNYNTSNFLTSPQFDIN